MTQDGSPAFPAIIPIEHSDVQGKDYPNYAESGMSLRDWFAGMIIFGMTSNSVIWTSGASNNDFVKEAYKLGQQYTSGRPR